MEKLSPAVLEAFGLQSRGIKKEKGYYLCSISKESEGLVKVHSTSETPEAICLQHSIKEHIAAGFPHTDRHRLTRAGEPYIIVGRETYIATATPPPQPETDLENEAHVLEIFRALARLHIASKIMPQKIPISPPLPETYTRQLSDLVQGGKQARRGPRMSDFDVLLIKHAPRATEIIQEAIERLEATNYSLLYTNAVSQGSLCHNALKEENIPVSQGTPYIVNFTQATTDLQLNDLAALIRRYAQRSSKAIPITKLVDIYDSIHPLPHQAADILYAQLIFPWAFMKLVTQYYSKKRNWTPNGLINRMETVLTEREDYETYIHTLI